MTEFIAHCREKDGEKQYVHEHLRGTAKLAGEFASKIGLEEHGNLLGLLHDLGKASAKFNNYIKSANGLIKPEDEDYVDYEKEKGKIDHATAGAQFIHQYFIGKNKEAAAVSQILSLVIASHHSGLIDCVKPDGEEGYSIRMSKEDEKTRLNECKTNLDESIKTEIESLLSKHSIIESIQQKIMSLREATDSKDTYLFKIGLLVRFLFSCLIDADRTNTADFEFPRNEMIRNQGKYISWNVLSEKLERRLIEIQSDSGINLLRQEISENCLKFASKAKGLYQLTVPTGGGKTLSSLRFALNHAKEKDMHKIVYVIPYTSIIDQNAQKTREILEEKDRKGEYLNNVVLEHHSNLTPEEESTRQRLLSENWDAPVVFTTMVQFLECLFGYGTRGARRMHQLANAVIIFDEIQTLPIKCVHIFNLAVRFLIKGCGSTVVLCTATQPLLDKVTPATRALMLKPDQQMMPDVQKLFTELKRYEILDSRKIGGWSELEIVELMKQELSNMGSVLTVVNTKKSAKCLFQQLKGGDVKDVYHLSTDMCPAHRKNIFEKIQKCLDEERPVICISTQLIEAGGDINFGTVIRYMAGLDSIVQAAGRCNRNGRPVLGRVFIVNPREENLDRLKEIREAREVTEHVLDDFKKDPTRFDCDIAGIKLMELYYKYHFYKRSDRMSYDISKNEGLGRTDNLFNLLSTNELSIKENKRILDGELNMFLKQSFMSASKAFKAIDLPTRAVIVQYERGESIVKELCSKGCLEQQYRLLKEAQRYSVNLYPHVFGKLSDIGAIYPVYEDAGILKIDKQYYSGDFGISESKTVEMEYLNP